MATGWGMLGEVLGGGMGTENAYQEGRLRSAQTEDALARAKTHQLEAIAEETRQAAVTKFKDAAAETGDKAALDLANALTMSTPGNPSQVSQSMLDVQELGFRQRAGAEDATPGARNAALAGVASGPVSPLDAVGAGGFVNIFDDEPVVENTPLGDAMITSELAQAGAAEALETRRLDEVADPTRYMSPGSVSEGGFKVPSGFMPDPADPSRVVPIPGGPEDPSQPAKLGTRERQVVARVMTSAANTVGDLQTIMMMDPGVSVGFFGQGATNPGDTLLSLTGGHLRRGLSQESSQQYNAVLGNLSNQLMSLEGMGLAGAQGIAAKFDSLILQPTDTVQIKMLKLAQMRQTVENSMQTLVSLGSLPEEAKADAQRFVSTIRNVVPFSPRDVITLSRPENAGRTLAEVVAETQGAQPQATPQVVQPENAGITQVEEGVIQLAPGVTMRKVSD